MRKKYSIEEIKKNYEQKKIWEKQFPLSYYIFRPISFYISSFLTYFTNSPSKIAFFGFFMSILGMIILIKNFWIGFFILVLYALFDAADGNIARATNQVTYYGKLVDGFLGSIPESLYFIPLSFNIYLINNEKITIKFFIENIYLTYISFFITILFLFSSLLSNIYDSLKNQKLMDKNYKTDINQITEKSKFSENLIYLLFINLGSYNFQLILLGISFILNTCDLFIIFYFLYYLIKFITYFIFYFYKAKKELNE